MVNNLGVKRDDLWELLKRTVQKGGISITTNIMVLEELERGKDDLYIWVKDESEGRFVQAITAPVNRFYKELETRYENTPWLQKRIQPKPVWADPWIIAWAKVNDATVVTGERSKIDPNDRTPENARRIPDVCGLEAIPCIGTEQFLRVIGATHRDTA